MNQRNQQPSSFKHKIANSSFFVACNKYWNGLPMWHQRGLMVLIPIVLVLIFFPVSHSDADVVKSANKISSPQRVSVPVMINGVETSASKPKPKIDENKDEKRISLNGNTDDATSDTKTKSIVTDNAGPEPWHNYTVKEGDTLGENKAKLRAILPGGIILVEKTTNIYGQEEYLETVVPISK